MFGASGTKNGVLRPYYVCSKRFNYHECQQDYLRGDLLEAAIIEDVKSIFRDEQFMARLWEEANKRLGAEKPDLEKGIARVDGQMAKTQGTIDRYFEAFEAGTLKVDKLNTIPLYPQASAVRYTGAETKTGGLLPMPSPLSSVP